MLSACQRAATGLMLAHLWKLFASRICLPFSVTLAKVSMPPSFSRTCLWLRSCCMAGLSPSKDRLKVQLSSATQRVFSSPYLRSPRAHHCHVTCQTWCNVAEHV
eukprot:GHRQ01021093.1.p3 GENE.GHRQ01021093.1~~GHRQ01021093.1.p3  ORF type:complete len:104 (+),score=11.55 GHRQ01021093.1:803-1114(+)